MGNLITFFFPRSDAHVDKVQQQQEDIIPNQNAATDVILNDTKPAGNVQENKADPISNKVCFGAGCYWGTENYFRNKFTKLHSDIAITGKVGFMGKIFNVIIRTIFSQKIFKRVLSPLCL